MKWIAFISFLPAAALAEPLIEVNIGAVAALSATDTDYSERFKYVYEESLKRAVESENQKAKSCGYKLSFNTSFYSGGDPMGPADSIKKVQEQKAWLLVGPDKSSEFVIAARTRDASIPIVSTMASANELNALDNGAYSAVPLVDEMATAAVKAIVSENYGRSFATIVDPTCLFCRDFAQFFKDAPEKNGLNSKWQSEVSTETPQLDKLKDQIKNEKPDFFLLPGYSKQSGFIMAELGKLIPDSKFVGADGWGDGEFGYLTKYPLSLSQKGISIRPGRPIQVMLNQTKAPLANLVWKNEVVKPPFTAFALVEIVEKTSKLLCSAKPKQKADFQKALLEKTKTYFHSSSGLNVYKLENGKLAYDRPAE